MENHVAVIFLVWERVTWRKLQKYLDLVGSREIRLQKKTLPLVAWKKHIWRWFFFSRWPLNLKTTQVTPCKTEWPNKLCLHHGNVLPPATACFGDSGGPLIVNEGGYSVVIGVANFIVDTTNLTSPTTKCNPTKGVSMYSEVQAYLPWIKSKIGQGQNIIYATISLGALQAPTTSGGPLGLFTSSFAPFGRSGRVTQASVIG